MLFDVMLRFDHRDLDLEQSLEAAGYEIIIPRAGRDTSCFQVALPTQPASEQFSDLVDAVCDVFAMLGPLLKKAAAGGTPVKALLDFGVNHNRELFVQNVTFSPRLLAILGELGLELNISIYV